MIRRGQSLLIVALAIFGLTARAFCYQADVTDISGTKYFPAVKDALAEAKEAIKVVMFTIESSAYKQKSKTNQLIDTLIEAKKRGVDVEVILDQNVDFVKRRHSSDWETRIKSTRAYKRLKDAGIKVYYDEPARYTHAKAVVIDKKIVILGSTNWTEASFDNNIETSVLINSEKLAEDILGYLKTIKVDEKIGKYLESIGPAVPVSWGFLENPRVAAFMVKEQAERAFDVYLYLLWKAPRPIGRPGAPLSAEKFDGNPQAKLTLFYDTIAKYLGIYEGWTITDYRRQIIKVFRKLERKYKLIKFEPRYAKEAAITLLNYEDAGKAYEIPEGEYFELPNDYFELGWNKGLSLRAKFCYLINLTYSDISDIKPFWSRSVKTITKQFGNVGQDVINKGMGELRRKKLLEVKYDDLIGKPYDERMPKMYKILKLYDRKKLELKLKRIEEKFGRAAYLKARKYAGIVFEENNPEVIEDIIQKTAKFGEKKVRKAFDIAKQKNIDNPKRSYNYVAGTIEKIE